MLEGTIQAPSLGTVWMWALFGLGEAGEMVRAAKILCTFGANPSGPRKILIYPALQVENLRKKTPGPEFFQPRGGNFTFRDGQKLHCLEPGDTWQDELINGLSGRHHPLRVLRTPAGSGAR